MDISVTLDDGDFRQAMEEYDLHSKRSSGDVLKQQAKLFVRDIVSITPPGHAVGRSSSTGTTILGAAASKKAGESAVRSDLARTVFEARNGGDPATIHARARSKRTGRVPRSQRPAAARGVARYRALMLSRVGILASGWSAAARALGLSLPAWISRHGTSRGSVGIHLTGGDLEISVTNSVRFAGTVRDMHRRMQWALDNRAAQMFKQLEDFAQKQARKKARL